jgi:DNA topoisomerase-2
VLSEATLKKVERSGVLENILSWARFKQNAELRRKTGGGKKSKLTGIPKLDDANDAGGSKVRAFTINSSSGLEKIWLSFLQGHECTLILTEGDSAKALAVSGIAVVGRDKYGVFPLKGKLLNVREASHQQILNNEEVQVSYSCSTATRELEFICLSTLLEHCQDTWSQVWRKIREHTLTSLWSFNDYD